MYMKQIWTTIYICKSSFLQKEKSDNPNNEIFLLIWDAGSVYTSFILPNGDHAVKIEISYEILLFVELAAVTTYMTTHVSRKWYP